MPCLFRPIKTVVGKFSINWSMKQMSTLSPSFHQDSHWEMLYQLNFEANVCCVSFVPSRQSIFDTLSTKLWSKCLPCLFRPIKTVIGKFSVNWSMKQMSALSPSSHQDSHWQILYQLNFEANVCRLFRPIKTVSVKFSINWTMQQMSAMCPSSHQDSHWYMLYQLNYEANVCHVSLVPSRQSLVNTLSTELWSKCVAVSVPFYQDSHW